MVITHAHVRSFSFARPDIEPRQREKEKNEKKKREEPFLAQIETHTSREGRRADESMCRESKTKITICIETKKKI